MNKEAVRKDVSEIADLLRSKGISVLFKGDTNNTIIQFFRYVFVGGLATVIDWGISALLFYIAFGQEMAVTANMLSFAAGLVTNYFLSKLWVFKESKMESKAAEFAGFALIGMVGLLITAGVTVLFRFLLIDITSAYQIIGKIIATGVAFFWNFFARKYLLFS